MAPYAERARSHPDGLVDLSVGTPVDPTPAVVQAALVAAANAPGYPLTAGSVEFREAAAAWLERRLGVAAGFDRSCILPVIGTKELVALVGFLFESTGRVLHPALAYPTYDVGARLAGCQPQPMAAGVLPALDGIALVWLNSPANPTGRVCLAAEMRAVVEWARAASIPVISDECYIELGWEDPAPVSVLHPSVCGDSYEGVLAVHSLSKRSNLAGYRAGFVAGDAAMVARLLEVRKHAGLILPAPVQAAAAAAYGDDAHVEVVRATYARRRDVLRGALAHAGFRIDHSEAGLYLWVTRGEACWDTVDWLSERGILVAPGLFYGAAGAHHVRVALTATDERVAAAAQRLRG